MSAQGRPVTHLGGYDGMLVTLRILKFPTLWRARQRTIAIIQLYSTLEKKLGHGLIILTLA